MNGQAKWGVSTQTSTCTQEYCSALKRKEILTRATTWMNLEIIMLSEVSQSEAKYCWTPLTWGTHSGPFIKIAGDIMTFDQEKGDLAYSRYRVSVRENEKF